MRACRFCACIFFICRRDDRGHAYCGEPCREAGYTRTRKEARRRFEENLGEEEARLDHCERQQAYRARCQQRVTDQRRCERVGSGTEASRPMKAEKAEVTDEEGKKGSAVVRSPKEQRCIVCGVRSHWVRWHPGFRLGRAAWAPRL